MSIADSQHKMKVNKPSYDGPLPAIVVQFTQDSQNLLLIDTGASVSALSQRTFELAKQLGLFYKHVARSVRITTINGQPLHYSGCADISFRIQGKHFNHSFFISDKLDHNVQYQGILGADFLSKFDSTVNFAKKCVKVENREFKFYEPNGHEAISETNGTI
jgi:hypothetical protein